MGRVRFAHRGGADGGFFLLTPRNPKGIRRPHGGRPAADRVGDELQGAAADCNSAGETHAWFDSRVAHQSSRVVCFGIGADRGARWVLSRRGGQARRRLRIALDLDAGAGRLCHDSSSCGGFDVRRLLPRPSLFALILGVLFVAASFTPSLVPRAPLMQGVLAGVVMALGYMLGRVIQVIWNIAAMPVARGDARDVILGLLGVGVLGLAGWSLLYSLTWQNDLRARMGLEPASEGHLIQVVVIALIVFGLLFLIGHVIALFSRFIRGRLERIMPPRRADVLGFLLVALGLFVLTRDGLLDVVINVLDETYETAQNLFDTAPPAPADLRKTGGPGSLVNWQAMGQPGRDFIMTGPDAADISVFTGRPALDPIRVYVGRANGDTPEARAELALEELKRLGGFDRKVLIVTSPTGTGWMDPGSHDPVEYMHDGDIATVSTQYSFLNSPFALVFETRTGLDQATATLAAIHDYWKTLPEDSRPRFYVHGLSLGAWSSMYATNIFRLVDDPVDGAFWAGPPFPSDFWNRVQHARNAETSWVRPGIGTGSFIRYAARGDDGSEGAAPWGDMRIMFLQYPSDPIVFFDPLSLLRAPVWMREPPGDGVSPYLQFMPVVTQFQLALDMVLATTTPAGFGHAYYAQDYIGPWAEVTAPEGWTDADTARLKAHCDNGFQEGCSNGEAPPAGAGG